MDLDAIFQDILNSPLPSARGRIYEESVDECGEGCDTECGTQCDNCGDDNCDGCEPVSPQSPVEIDDVMDDLGDDQDPVDSTMDSELDEPIGDDDLDPLESRNVDDVINTVGTSILMKDEIGSEEELKEFVNSMDSDIAVSEGYLTEKTIIKFDKNAKKAQLYEVAVFACAREKNDPLWRKLQTVWKLERVIKAKLRKKYNAPANRKVKEYLARAKKSKSGFLAKIAAKLTGKK